jgi:hypothetical protein
MATAARDLNGSRGFVRLSLRHWIAEPGNMPYMNFNGFRGGENEIGQ